MTIVKKKMTYDDYFIFNGIMSLNQSTIDRDKMKDDAIAHLSDQLMALTSRLQEVERRQQQT
jgi:hypothetical protein